MKRPQVIALDIVETVFALEPLGARLKSAALPEAALRLFFAQMLRDAFALEASGVYQPFREVAAGALAVVMASHGMAPEKQKIDAVLAGFAELPAHTDIAAGLDAAAHCGFRVVALTNGGADNTRKLLERAGIAHHFEKVISIDEVRRWKPNREVYLHAARTAGVAPERMTLIAAHAWDVHGAKQAGLGGAWLKRQDKLYQPAMLPPDAEGETLAAVVEKLAL